MAISIDYGYTLPVTTKNLAIPDIDYTVWPRIASSDSPADMQAHYTAIGAPLDRQPKSWMFRRKVTNIYERSGISAIYQSPIKEGIRLGAGTSVIMKITDSDDPTHPIYIPASCTTTWILGLNPNISVSQLKWLLDLNVGMMFPTDSVTTNQLASWLAGSLTHLDETSEG